MTFLNLLQQTDLSVLFFINQQLSNPVFDFVFKSTHYLSYVMLGLLVAYFAFRKEKFIVLSMIVVVIASTLTAAVLKNTTHRERPYQTLDVRQLVEEDNNRSFPSNHVQLSFALSTIVFYFYRRSGLVLFLLSLLMGIGRIYVGVHYPSDVLGGAIIGIMIAFVILKMKHDFIGRKTLT